MKLETFFEKFELFAEAPNGVQKLRELILQLAVQGKLVPQDPNDEPASVLLDKIKFEKEWLVNEGKIKRDKPLPAIKKDEIPYNIPENWIWVKLDAICNQITDGTHHTPTYTITGIPFLSVKDISSGKINLTNTKYISKEEHQNLIKRCNPEFEDVLLTKVGTTGIAKVIDIDTEFSIFVSLALLKFCKHLISPYYLELLINSPLVKKQSKDNTQGVGNKNLVLKSIKGFIVPLPPLNEQKRIVAKVDQLMSLCDELEERQKKKRETRVLLNNVAINQLLTACEPDTFAKHWQRICNNFDLLYSAPENIGKLRQAILQLAVMGKLVPQDPNDEPASVLLDKIRFEKELLIQEGKIKQDKAISAIELDEIPFGLPDSWVWARFSHIAVIASNLVKPESYLDLPHVAPDNIEKQTGKLLPYRTVREDNIRSGKHRFFSGQILYSKIRPNLAKVTLINFDGLCSADMYPINTYINASYLVKYMLSQTFLSMAVKNDTRVAMPKINQEELNKILIAIPPLMEQKRIVSIVDQLMNICDQLEAKLTKSQFESEKLMDAAVRQLLIL